MQEEPSVIQKFYKDSKIFITGGTGFLGKVLIEKLLRCTDVSAVYLLVREKKGKKINSRIDELFNDIVFNKLKKERQFKHKIIPIKGDCALPHLGISQEDQDTLTSNVDIIFHVAATVKFDENIKLAYNINVKSTEDLIELAKRNSNLKAFIHVSTAYSNSILTDIDEKIYDLKNFESTRKILENTTFEEAENLAPKLIGEWPNTYTFTKALAEQIIKNKIGKLPAAVFRPAIVLSCNEEPIKGWIDNLYGPTGVAAGCATGLLRVMLANPNNVADLIPVDTCVCALIVCAWDVQNKNPERNPNNIPVYNYISSKENPITWAEYTELSLLSYRDVPMITSLWLPMIYMVRNKFMYLLLRFLLHTIPAYILDLFYILLGKKPRYIKIYKKINKLGDIFSFFANKRWNFSNQNVQDLWEKLNKTDQKLFPLSIKTTHWVSYIRSYTNGIKLYLVKESNDNLQAARRKLLMQKLIHYSSKWILIITCILYVRSLMNPIFGKTLYCKEISLNSNLSNYH